MINVCCKKSYGNRTVLDVDGLIFESGKRYAIIGSNGSGKSTLLKIIAGLVSPDKGAIVQSDFPLKGANVCYMTQSSFAFDSSLSQNVFSACPTLPRLKNRDERVYYNDRCYKLIDDMGLWNLRHKNAKKLSGGETQRMALCRVLVARHKVLLLDEPTSAMDVEATAVAEKVLDGYFSSYSPTIIFATHSIKQAERIADYVLFLHDGKIVEYGSPKDLFTSPKTPLLQSFLQNE